MSHLPAERAPPWEGEAARCQLAGIVTLCRVIGLAVKVALQLPGSFAQGGKHRFDAVAGVILSGHLIGANDSKPMSVEYPSVTRAAQILNGYGLIFPCIASTTSIPAVCVSSLNSSSDDFFKSLEAPSKTEK